jgi:NADH-quinone oxidoreductase subunit C
LDDRSDAVTEASSLPYPVGSATPSAALAEALVPLAASVEGTLGQSLTDVDLAVAAGRLLETVRQLRDAPELAFDYLRNIAGVDYEAEGLALKYQLYSFKHGHTVQVTVNLPPYSYPHAVVPSLVSLYPAAEWHEREAGEMFGIDFAGHPNPKNLLLEEDLHIHPLLKAHPLQAMEVKQGIEKGPPGFNI